ncbi:MAG: hypothetical protein M1829_004573 [Trizodia sp. TS-e1964]|nr:MAG: hypothetical protein M1829_004573 [Trizodia sp. TS-e1964]
MSSVVNALRSSALRSSSFLRTFTSTPHARALKESDRHNENAAEEQDKHLQDSLSKQRDGKGLWKGELASESESAIKADREKADTSKAGVEKMQNESLQK